ncbi:MAG TPA: hypothetical protein VLV78_07065 [Thermoanaerobaculia bacterium]|nr:hypothetical protein [Thermoanaerobaculia bacterium]
MVTHSLSISTSSASTGGHFINGKLRELYTRLGVDQVTTFHSFDWIGFLLDPDDEHIVELNDAVQRITVDWQQRINVFRNVIVPMEPADAAVGGRKRDARRERWRSAMKSTDAGYVNKNEQEVVRRTDRPGNDHGQRVYLVRCRKCNAEYGANGSDIWIRKCPLCQGGKPGL